MSEVFFILFMIGGLLVPSAAFRFWWLFWPMFTFGIVFGIYEGIAKMTSGMTVSQHFWDLSKVYPDKAWIIVVMMQLSWMSLLLHLAWRLIWRDR